jgi:DNA polymerase-3 subunit gamma/tau
VGQQSLTHTLKTAIASGRLAHAYLFCGPRGVGKTTCARIFAKTINCEHPTPDGEACNECPSCKAFNDQRSYNINELDAASNNSVDNIRDLTEQVRIPPQTGRYRVIIIDEVHMLSQAAFNAFLKTLEEPPEYAIFILATTEKQKVIPTILSRCQIYDFARITVPDIVQQLQYVCEQENIEAEPAALNVIAQKADGAMRDALSIFDQLVAFCGSRITYQQAIEVLNILDTDYYFRMVSAALAGDVAQVLLLFDEVLQKGFDAGQFIVGIESHLRDVLVAKDAQTLPLLETAESVKVQYKEQAGQCPATWIFASLNILNECDMHYRTSSNKRLVIELGLIKWCGLVQAAASPAVQTAPAPQVVQRPASPTQQNAVTKPVAPTAQVASAMPAIPKIPTIPSIHSTVSTQGQAAVNPSPTAEKKETQHSPFTKDQFSDAWIGLKRHFPREERLQAILSMCEPQIDGEKIRIGVSNPWQKEEIQRLREAMLAFLRQTLQNEGIEMDVVIDESRQQHTAYTAEEKMKRMQKEYPELTAFRQSLGLIIE